MMPTNTTLIKNELKIVNGSPDFWRLLDENLSVAACHHDHGNGNEHFHMSGHFSIAQSKITDAINLVFSDDFDLSNPEHLDQLFTLAAVRKAQDQLSGGDNFVSQRSLKFDKHFNLSNALEGKKIAGHTVAMPNAKEYLVKKFNLNSTRAKADVILESQATALQKAGQLVDLGFKDAVDPLVKMAGSVYKAAPSLAITGLALGTAQMVLRSCGNQDDADTIRDNIGAATEAAAFFVLANGVLENLSHSFILAAPAFTAVAAYDTAYRKLKPMYDYFSHSLPEETDNPNAFIEIEVTDDMSEENDIIGSFTAKELSKTMALLTQTKLLVNEDEMWVGLRKHQIAYQDNDIEETLKNGLDSLISALSTNPTKINTLLQETFTHTIRDSFEMLNAYGEVYEKQNPASGIKQLREQFCDHFARDGILLSEPSKDAKMAAFLCKSNWGLVSFEERIKESLPHMPTGQQVLLAATFIGALYSASEIYKATTGEKETYCDYVTNFPDHLFEWLQLDQMYENMGGDAQFTEVFKDFFAKFNLAENSTHLGIAAAPFFAYGKMGSKMFDTITHTPANYMAYAADVAKTYVGKISHTINRWFDTAESTVVPFADIEMGANGASDNCEAANKEEAPLEQHLDQQDVTAPKDTLPQVNGPLPRTQLKKKSHPLSDKKPMTRLRANHTPSTQLAFCGSAEQILAQLQQLPPANTPTQAMGERFSRRTHVHGPNCNHVSL